jgi:hypothetical protein
MSFNHWKQLADALHPACADVVAETATFIAETYSATAPRNTGFMADSAYVVTANGSTYGANAGSPPGDSYLLPEVAAPPDDLTAIAAVAANYAVYQELGTVFDAPQPAWQPAVDAAQAKLDDELAAIDGKLQGAIS